MKFDLGKTAITMAESPLIEDEVTNEANDKLRYIVGPNFKFYFNQKDQRYELWEQRGPMFQLLMPIVINGTPLNRITDNELRFAHEFCLRRRKNRDENYHKYKEYKQWTAPDEYVDWRPKEDNSEWKDTSPRPDNYKRVKKNAVIN